MSERSKERPKGSAAFRAADWAADRGDRWRAHLPGMEASLAPVDGPLIDALRLDAPCRVADVGCGGGATARAMLARADWRGSVDGFDVSPALVEAARASVPPDAAGVAFHIADVATDAPPERPYDRLVSRFGIMFFQDPLRAFRNLGRWLRADGRFAFAVWSGPVDNPWVTVVRDVVAAITAVPAPQPGAPGLFRYADASTLLSVLAAAGFAELHVETWKGELPLGGAGSPADAARFALTAFSSFDELLSAAGPAAREAAQRTLTEALAGHHRDGAVWLPAAVHVVSGSRGEGSVPG